MAQSAGAAIEQGEIVMDRASFKRIADLILSFRLSSLLVHHSFTSPQNKNKVQNLARVLQTPAQIQPK